jgi:hypothetical protein
MRALSRLYLRMTPGQRSGLFAVIWCARQACGERAWECGPLIYAPDPRLYLACCRRLRKLLKEAS